MIIASYLRERTTIGGTEIEASRSAAGSEEDADGGRRSRIRHIILGYYSMAARYLPAGSVMMVHQVTGTYFCCDGYTDAVGALVQNWHLDPVNDANSHRWTLVQNGDGTVCIESHPNGHHLAAGAKPAENPSLQKGTEGLHERWRFVPEDLSSDSFVIVSVVHPHYALALADHAQINDKYIVLTRMWGGGPNLSQVWKVFPAESS